MARRILVGEIGILLFLFLGCNSKYSVRYLSNSKWKEVSNLYGIGGPGEWQLTPDSTAEIVMFKGNNEFVSTEGSDLTRYKLVKSGDKNFMLLIFNGLDSVAWEVKFLKADTLLINYQCIEGCAKKYIRIN